ncbi:formyltransferase family protein [Desulfococcaceae bacterium HSG9]|nr:formyltransferase family protein [Desulfococcaceae bacterium HSG9]
MERILFIGRNTRYAITTNAFLRLVESIRNTTHRIVGVVHTHEDDYHDPNSLRRLAQKHGIKTISFTKNDINAPASLSTLSSFQATCFLVVQYPRIFDSSVISIPSNACLNIHRGWPLRGGSIDQRAIYYKQTKYFVILHKIDCGIDTGDILAKESVPIEWRTETGYSLDTKVTDAGGRLIRKGFFPRLETGDFTGTVQNVFQTQYENKWKPDRKIISPKDINYDDAERLARALHHPRETGLVVKMGSDLYRWDSSFIPFAKIKLPNSCS